MASTVIEDLWQQHRAGVSFAQLTQQCDIARDWFYLAVLAFADQRDRDAASYAAIAAEHAPHSRVLTTAADYLDRVSQQGRSKVYSSPEGFLAFIRGGGNTVLYQQLQQYLRERYNQLQPRRLLDIGVGDGHALLPAITDAVGHIDLVEPSQTMLDRTSATLSQQDIPHRAFPVSLQQLCNGAVPAANHGQWELAQATFSLHNVDRQQRTEALRWLRTRVARIVIAEFDVAPGIACEPAWFDYVLEHYESGVAEYAGDGGLVTQGFLMPVMFGYFDPEVIHSEQPVAQWLDDLSDAGFSEQKEPVLLHNYWWAPGYVLEAS